MDLFVSHSVPLDIIKTKNIKEICQRPWCAVRVDRMICGVIVGTTNISVHPAYAVFNFI